MLFFSINIGDVGYTRYMSFVAVHPAVADIAGWLLEILQEKCSIDLVSHETTPFLHRDLHPNVAWVDWGQLLLHLWSELPEN